MFTTSATRNNLHYNVRYKETDADKYNELRQLIEFKDCPTIVYASRTKRTKELAERLTKDGFPALPYNGKMDPTEKIANQEAFIRDEVKVMVATSAFGMGVDKPNVGLVVHYDISDSLENYVQEAGRAGRDQNLQAECYVLYNDDDLNKHFIMLNQEKVSISEIQQVWKTIKKFTKNKLTIQCSALDIARDAWGDSDTKMDRETRVTTAIAALEDAGFLKRGRNYPRIYATSIRAKNMEEASHIIENSNNYENADYKDKARRIINSLISRRSIASAKDEDAESRIDYLSDILGIDRKTVFSCISSMIQDRLLATDDDMSAFIAYDDTENKAKRELDRFIRTERFLLSKIGSSEEQTFSLKELNTEADNSGIKGCSVKNIRTLLFYLSINKYIKKKELVADQCIRVYGELPSHIMVEKFEKRIDICQFIVNNLYNKVLIDNKRNGMNAVEFSVIGLLKDYKADLQTRLCVNDIKSTDIEDALLYLQKIGVMKLEGGFLVLYNKLNIQRYTIDKEGKNILNYNKKHYEKLNGYYQQKIQQIHIVGEYANLMVKDYNAALQFVDDYFSENYKEFINKYFKGERKAQISQNITPKKYQQIFGTLSATQKAIIEDKESRCIVVAAGPGSGKTSVLVHKLASILMLEDVKHEQLLMLTFSRAAATEFKQRLMELVGNAANNVIVQIKTFHSYCFDLLGKIGNIEDSKDVVAKAVTMIQNGEVDQKLIAKCVLVIDEAQDMDEHEFALVEALMAKNEDMRVIAVGDDDQNIYEFRGSNSVYMKKLIIDHNAKNYDLVENFRSAHNVVALANSFSTCIGDRLKTKECVAVNTSNGNVVITKHTSSNFEEAVLKEIQETYKKGTACVLTIRNDQAANMVGLLTKKGYRAKLIQSLNGFRLSNLMELRHFMKIIHNNLHGSPEIDKMLWSEAKSLLNKIYNGSTCLELCNKLLQQYEDVNPKRMYWTDLKEYIIESNIEDFYQAEQGCITVSTIHKAKGREFDSVYMLLDNPRVSKDEEKRLLYVGLTRAKQNLFIHCNNNVFDNYNPDGVLKTIDTNQYNPNTEIEMQLGLSDVNLGFYKNKKETLIKLRSGMPLNVQGDTLTANIEGVETPVAQLSKKSKAEVDAHKKNGYTPTSASIGFVVAWKGEEDPEESAIVIPTIKLKKQNC